MQSRSILAGMIVGIVWGTMPAADAALVHQYSFNETEGAVAVDSAGGANGTVVGTNFTWTGTELDLPGNGNSSDTNDIDFVDLPNGIISALGSTATFEVWYTWDGGGAWQRVYDFGITTGPTNDQGIVIEDMPGTGDDYIFLTPSADGGQRVAVTTNSGGGEVTVNTRLAPTEGEEHYVAYTYDSGAGIARIYVDGNLIDTGDTTAPLSDIDDRNNWLGRSQWGGDAMLDGQYNELRIHDTALTARDVGINAGLGPDDSSGNGGTLTGTAVAGQDTIVVQGAMRYFLEFTYSGLPEPVAIFEDNLLVWSSSDTNILSVSQSGVVTAHSIGTADVIATYDGGAPQTKSVEVTDRVLKQQWGMNGPQASDFGGGTPFTNTLTDADGTFWLADRNGTGQLEFDSSFAVAHADMPNGLASSLGAATFEMWFTPRDAGAPDQRAFTFGVGSNGEVGAFAGAGDAVSHLTLTARDVVARRFVAEATWGESSVIVGADSPLYAVDQEQHVAVVLNGEAGSLTLYVSGVEVGTVTEGVPLLDSSLPDVNNWLGRSNDDGDGWLDALVDEFRIYEGVLTAEEIAVNQGVGPDGDPFQDPGDFVSVSLTADNTELVEFGNSALAIALAEYTNVSGVPVNSLPGTMFSVDDSSVVTVSDSGLVTPLVPGTATVTVVVGTEMDSLDFIVVTNPNPAVVIHRYSFDENPGETVVVDSVGGRDGTFIGGGSVWTNDLPTLVTNESGFGGGQLTLTGIGESGDTDGIAYVDLGAGFMDAFSNSVTFEIWFTFNGEAPSPDGGANWQRMIDFGTSGQIPPTGTQQWMFWCAQDGGNANGIDDFCVDILGTAGRPTPQVETGTPSPEGIPQHAIYVFDLSSDSSILYINGEVAGTGTASSPLSEIETPNSWLGRSQFNADDLYNGVYDEFRVYSGAMTPKDVQDSALCGPDVLWPCEAVPVSTIISATQAGSDLILQWTGDANSVLSTLDLVGGSFTDTGAAVTETNGMKEATVPMDADGVEAFGLGE